jgi:hypothetical protein
MPPFTPPPFMSPSYSYNEAENALGHAIGFGPVHQRGTIRMRLKHLQRLNLVELNLGKQRRAKYSRAQIVLWLLALILAETGADPVQVVAALKRNWKHLASTIELATSDEARSGRPFYMITWLRGLSGPVRQKPTLSIDLIQLQFPNPYAPVTEQLRQLREVVAGNSDEMVALVNVTRPLSRLENALPPRG